MHIYCTWALAGAVISLAKYHFVKKSAEGQVKRFIKREEKTINFARFSLRMSKGLIFPAKGWTGEEIYEIRMKNLDYAEELSKLTIEKFKELSKRRVYLANPLNIFVDIARWLLGKPPKRQKFNFDREEELLKQRWTGLKPKTSPSNV